MKSKILSLFALVALAVSLVGCKSSAIAPSVLRLGVGAGASYSLLKYPEAAPAVKASAAIICSQASNTNLSPEAVYAAVDAYKEKTPESVLIVNSALSLYTLIWNGYGATAVTNNPQFKLYLEATCGGLTDAVATIPIVPSSNTLSILRAAPPVSKQWPQVSFPK